jgi:hydrogenase expression/formation protein HypC
MCLAVPGKIVSINESDPPEVRCGKVDFAGIRKDICLAYTPEAAVGDYVLVHVGFALNVVDEDEAQRIFETLAEMEQLAEGTVKEPQTGETACPTSPEIAGSQRGTDASVCQPGSSADSYTVPEAEGGGP